MAELPASFEALLRAWNETDHSRIREHLDAALAPEIMFCDPNYLITGIDAFEAMVREFLEKYPVVKCEHTSGFNEHHNRYRYNWLVSVGGQPAVAGMDVAELNDAGKVIRIDGFFGEIPPL